MKPSTGHAIVATLIFSIVSFNAYAKEGDVKHIDPLTITIETKDKIVKAGVVSIEAKGPRIKETSDVIIVDHNPKDYGIGVSVKF